MKRVMTLVGLAAWLIPAAASAEFKELRQTIFGMD
jgi:hypothetical protein